MLNPVSKTGRCICPHYLSGIFEPRKILHDGLRNSTDIKRLVVRKDSEPMVASMVKCWNHLNNNNVSVFI